MKTSEMIFNSLMFFDPVHTSPAKVEHYNNVAKQMFEILWDCYNDIDVQFKLYDFMLDEFEHDQVTLPSRKSLSLLAKDIWTIKLKQDQL